MLFQISTLVSAQPLLLYNNEFLNDFKGYCSPTYNYVSSKDKLKKVITVFRHGDRAPLAFKNHEEADDSSTVENMLDGWNKRNCMKCTLKKCEAGELTVKGYEQAENLGSFIDKNYVSRLTDINAVLAVHTGINRTLSTLQGVMKNLPGHNKSIVIDFELVNPNECFMKSGENKSMLEKYVKKIIDEKESQVYKLDRIFASVCNDVPYNCNEEKCDFTQISNFLGNMRMQFEDKMAQIREDIVRNGATFAYYAHELSKYLQNKNQLVLISAHDSTINRILNGLGVPSKSFPSYADAIFIEVREKHDKEYVRIIYGGELVTFGLYKEKHVHLKQFVKYLDMFGDKYNEVKNICETQKHNKTHHLTELFKDVNAAIQNKKTIIAQKARRHLNKSKGSKGGYFFSMLSSITHKLKSALTYGQNPRSRGNAKENTGNSFLFGWFRNKKSGAKCKKGSTSVKTADPIPYSSSSSSSSSDECSNKCHDDCEYSCEDSCNNECEDSCNNECEDTCNDGCYDSCDDGFNDGCNSCTKPTPKPIKVKKSHFTNPKTTTITNCDLATCGAGIVKPSCGCNECNKYGVCDKETTCNAHILTPNGCTASVPVTIPSNTDSPQTDHSINKLMNDLYG